MEENKYIVKNEQLKLFSPFENNQAKTFELPDGNLIFYPAAFTPKKADRYWNHLNWATKYECCYWTILGFGIVISAIVLLEFCSHELFF